MRIVWGEELKIRPVELHEQVAGGEAAEDGRDQATQDPVVRTRNWKFILCLLDPLSPFLPTLAFKIELRDFPGGPLDKTPSSQCRGPGCDPWSGN